MDHLEITHNGRTEHIDLNTVFDRITMKGKLVEAKLKHYEGIIRNEEFFRLKALIKNLVPKALDASMALIRSQPERDNLLQHTAFIELNYIEIFAYTYDGTPESFSAEIRIGTECYEKKDFPVYMYDARGCIEAAYTINFKDEVIQGTIAFNEDLED